VTKLKWKKRRSGLLVPEPLWFVRVFLPVRSPHYPAVHDIETAHYWSDETKSFTDFTHATAFLVKKQAESMLFWITAKYAKSIIGKGRKIGLVKAKPGEVLPAKPYIYEEPT